jgi:pantoate--beta-alanine ligase
LTVLTSVDQVREAKVMGCALVPTMGALHEGHLSLVSKAKRRNESVGVSIFVNPTQFGVGEDFSKYPRNFDRDCQMLEEAGADWVFAPQTEEIYPRASTQISVPIVTELYEGKLRPGHFEGVATIVLKLFQICGPAQAIFGLKDLQQCAVIKRMVEDLNVPVNLHFEETVREWDGLAKSSRNVYLSSSQRAIASKFYLALQHCGQGLTNGENVPGTISKAVQSLESEGFSVDYIDLIDFPTFHPTATLGDFNAIIGAIRLGTTRLIDNLLLFPPQNMP